MTYEEAVAAITPGLYRHFKGKYYRVLSIARHSETTDLDYEKWYYIELEGRHGFVCGKYVERM